MCQYELTSKDIHVVAQAVAATTILSIGIYL